SRGPLQVVALDAAAGVTGREVHDRPAEIRPEGAQVAQVPQRPTSLRSGVPQRMKTEPRDSPRHEERRTERLMVQLSPRDLRPPRPRPRAAPVLGQTAGSPCGAGSRCARWPGWTLSPELPPGPLRLGFAPLSCLLGMDALSLVYQVVLLGLFVDLFLLGAPVLGSS